MSSQTNHFNGLKVVKLLHNLGTSCHQLEKHYHHFVCLSLSFSLLCSALLITHGGKQRKHTWCWERPRSAKQAGSTLSAIICSKHLTTEFWVNPSDTVVKILKFRFKSVNLFLFLSLATDLIYFSLMMFFLGLPFLLLLVFMQYKSTFTLWKKTNTL